MLKAFKMGIREGSFALVAWDVKSEAGALDVPIMLFLFSLIEMLF
jgi:hypothetical protein